MKKISRTINRILQKSPKLVDDSFIKWLTFANAGMLHPGNIYCFEIAINDLPSDNPIIEIGSFCGLSTNIILYLLAKRNLSNDLITSDKWVFEGKEEKFVGDSEISHDDFRNFVKSSFVKNVSFFSNSLPYTIEEFSNDFFNFWKQEKTLTDIFERSIKLGGGISFAYVDGDHSYEQTLRDFQNIHEILDVGGYILFDDSSDTGIFDSKYVAKEVSKRKDYQCVIKNPNYLLKKIV